MKKNLNNIFIFILITINLIKCYQSCLFEGCNCMYSERTSRLITTCQGNRQLQLPKRNQSILMNNVIHSIFLKNFNLMMTPENVFDGLIIDELQLSNNGIQILTENTFKTVKSLKTLHINEPSLQMIVPNTFKPLYGKLQTLDLQSSNLNDDKFIRFRNELRYLDSIQHLILSQNQLTTLNPLVISGFRNLNILNLEANRINKLEPSTFVSNSNLNTLLLSNNELKDMNEVLKALEPIKNKLFTLSLKSNQIQFLPDMTGFTQLNSLNLEDNYLRFIQRTNLNGLKELTSLNLASNKIEFIEDRSFSELKNLKFLHIENNRLNKIPNVKDLPNIQEYYIANQNSFTKSADLISLNESIDDENGKNNNNKNNNNITVKSGVVIGKIDEKNSSTKLSFFHFYFFILFIHIFKLY